MTTPQRFSPGDAVKLVAPKVRALERPGDTARGCHTLTNDVSYTVESVEGSNVQLTCPGRGSLWVDQSVLSVPPNLQEFVTKRLESFRDCTAMWGSHEAVELQAMQLLELESFMRGQNNQRAVIDMYVTCLRRLQNLKYLADVPQPLHEWETTEFGEALYTLCQKVRVQLKLLDKPTPKTVQDLLDTP